MHRLPHLINTYRQTDRQTHTSTALYRTVKDITYWVVIRKQLDVVVVAAALMV